jgi:single-strand DNA-binding protein
MNKVMLIGNLTRDAEVRHTNSGFPITEMGIAVNDRRKNAQSGDWEEKPFFFTMKMLGDRGEKIAQYLVKGKKVGIVGKLEYRAWETPAGEKRSVVEVLIEDLEFLSSNQGEGGSPRQDRPAAEAPAGRAFGGGTADDLGGVEVDDEEIPF